MRPIGHVKEGFELVNRKNFAQTRLSLASLTLTVVASCAALPASAVQTHVLKSGETLGSLALRYHVEVKELMAWNGIKNPENLRDGIKLLIPTAKPDTIARTTMYKSATIKGDRISVRVGPGTDHRRVNMFDNGAPMIVTAQRDGWAQVQMPDGKSGWVLLSYLHVGGMKMAQPNRVAKTAPAQKPVKRVAKWTPAKPAVVKHVGKKEATQWKNATKIARETAAKKAHAKHLAALQQAEWKAAQARHIAEARKANARRRELAKITRHAPQVAHHRYTPEADAPQANNDIVRSAYSYRGTPYRYGGSAKGGFDCSGFTSYLYRQKGVNLPHSARAQAGMGQKVDKGNLKAGDLVFFHTVTPGISHVGMYVGNGKFVHASSRRSGGVRVDSLNSGYYNERFRGARRYSK